MRHCAFHGSLILAVTLAGCAAQDPPWPPGRWLDLTHPFAAETVYWPTAAGFRLEAVFDGTTEAGYHYSANQFCAAEHGGTHIDAPIHFAAGGATLDQVPVDTLIGSAIVVDVSAKALADRDYRISAADFAAFEQQHGPIPAGVIVLLRTGFGRYWPNPQTYLGTTETGAAAVRKLHFPGLAPEGARWLAERRRIKAVGLDTASIDYGQSTLFESHRILAAAGIPILENVASLERLPVTGAWIVALPMNIKGGSGGPLRIVARVP